MKRIIAALALGLILAAPASGLAAKGKSEYDMANITCKEMFSDAESVTFMLFWIDGYLSHKKNNMVFSEDSMKEITDALTEECKGNPNKKLGGILKDW